MAELRGVDSDEPDTVCAGGAAAVHDDRVAVDDAFNGRGLDCDRVPRAVSGLYVRTVWERE